LYPLPLKNCAKVLNVDLETCRDSQLSTPLTPRTISILHCSNCANDLVCAVASRRRFSLGVRSWLRPPLRIFANINFIYNHSIASSRTFRTTLSRRASETFQHEVIAAASLFLLDRPDFTFQTIHVALHFTVSRHVTSLHCSNSQTDARSNVFFLSSNETQDRQLTVTRQHDAVQRRFPLSSNIGVIDFTQLHFLYCLSLIGCFAAFPLPGDDFTRCLNFVSVENKDLQPKPTAFHLARSLVLPFTPRAKHYRHILKTCRRNITAVIPLFDQDFQEFAAMPVLQTADPSA
jgi:hypothetical protein